MKSPASVRARRVRIAPAPRGPTHPARLGVGEQAESAPGVGDEEESHPRRRRPRRAGLLAKDGGSPGKQ